MGYDRYPRENERSDRDHRRGRDSVYSNADQGREDHSRDRYGARDYGRQEQHQQFDRGGYGREQSGNYGGSQGFYGRGREDHRPEHDRHAGDDRYGARPAGGDQRGYGRQPQGYDYEDRGFLARAGDEVRSWFGDDEAERRREFDSRYDDRADRSHDSRSRRHDDDYHGWRSSQIAALDRDYEEFRHENRTRFETEFANWRTNRQGQRELLNGVVQHQEVVGSDDVQVGTVDKVRGDRIMLAKGDADTGGRHYSIPSNWVKSVDGKVTLTKTADEARTAWRDEDRNQTMSADGDDARGEPGRQQYRPQQAGAQQAGTRRQAGTSTGRAGNDGDGFGSDGNLNRSFPGTY